MQHRQTRTALVGAALLVLAGCSKDGSPSGPTPAEILSLSITPDSPSVVRDQSVQLSAIGKDAQERTTTNVRASWSSSSSTVASVDGTGTVRGLTQGSARITASVGSIVASTIVSVRGPQRDSTVVTVAGDNAVITVGQGSSVVIPSGSLPAGSKVVIEELPLIATTGTPLGPRLSIRVVAATATSQTAHSLSGTAAESGGRWITVRYRTKLSRPFDEIKNHIQVVASDAADATKSFAVESFEAVEKVGEFGERALEVTSDYYISSVTAVLTYTYDPSATSCNVDAWRLARPLNPGTPDRNKTPLVLIHGWQPTMATCNDAYAFAPEQMWRELISQLGPDLRDKYEIWTYRYPTFYPVAEAARRLAEMRPLLQSERPFVIVAHSMGGLVGAKYMVDIDEDGVLALITLGTPFGGSPLAEPVLSFITEGQWAAFTRCVGPLAALIPAKAAVLGTAGAGDLKPEGPFITRLLGSHSSFSSRLDSYAGSTQGVSVFGNSLMAGGSCALGALGRGPSDGIVPEVSTYAAGTRTRRLFTGVTHLSITADQDVLTAVTNRLGEIANPPTAARLFVTGGEGQQGSPGSLLPEPIVVRAVTAAGAGVPNVNLAFQAAAGSGSVSETTVATDGSGLASVRWTLGPNLGVQTLQISAPGVGPVTVQAAARDRQDPDMPVAQPLTIGGQFQCAIVAGGQAKCWGQNAAGQLGDGTRTVRPVPQDPVTEITLVSVSGGDNFACGLTPQGAAYCWGSNSEGELANGGSAESTTPVAVLPTLRFRYIATGMAHACAITTGAETHCWGMDRAGQLGAGGVPYAFHRPVRVATSVRFKSLALGIAHTCGLSEAGRAYCWGNFGDWALGVPEVSGTCRYTAGPFPCAMSPGAVSGDNTYVQIVSGYQHTCALTAEGRAFCWGTTPGTHVGENYGLGDGTTQASKTPVPVAAGHSFTQLVAGGTHTCGLKTGGQLWCWGRNMHGEIGDGTRDSRLSPVPAAGALRFGRVAAGPGATCGITAGGEVYCWGYNRFGGWVGDGSSGGSASPVRVQNLTVPAPRSRSR